MRFLPRDRYGRHVFLDDRPSENPAAPEDELLEARRVIELAVAQVFGMDARNFTHMSRGVAETAFARQVAMYLAHVACRMTMTEVGRLFGRDRTTVSHACRLIEDRRDDRSLDHVLDLLEWAVPVMARRRAGDFLRTIRE